MSAANDSRVTRRTADGLLDSRTTTCWTVWTLNADKQAASRRVTDYTKQTRLQRQWATDQSLLTPLSCRHHWPRDCLPPLPTLLLLLLLLLVRRVDVGWFTSRVCLAIDRRSLLAVPPPRPAPPRHSGHCASTHAGSQRQRDGRTAFVCMQLHSYQCVYPTTIWTSQAAPARGVPDHSVVVVRPLSWGRFITTSLITGLLFVSSVSYSLNLFIGGSS